MGEQLCVRACPACPSFLANTAVQTRSRSVYSDRGVALNQALSPTDESSSLASAIVVPNWQLFRDAWTSGPVMSNDSWSRRHWLVGAGILPRTGAPSRRRALTVVQIFHFPRLALVGLVRRPAPHARSTGCGWYLACTYGRLSSFPVSSNTARHHIVIILLSCARWNPGVRTCPRFLPPSSGTGLPLLETRVMPKPHSPSGHAQSGSNCTLLGRHVHQNIAHETSDAKVERRRVSAWRARVSPRSLLPCVPPPFFWLLFAR